MGERCDRCNSTGQDRRTLWMACFYAMNELPVPFTGQRLGERNFFTLRVCKRCRAEWMAAIAAWFAATPDGEDHDADEPVPSIGSGIFVRDRGAVREITPEEWDRRYAERPDA